MRSRGSVVSRRKSRSASKYDGGHQSHSNTKRSGFVCHGVHSPRDLCGAFSVPDIHAACGVSDESLKRPSAGSKWRRGGAEYNDSRLTRPDRSTRALRVEQFIIEWGYWAVALGCFFEGETIAVLAGVLAHRHTLRLDGAIISACLGSLAGDQLWFLLGRFAGDRQLRPLRGLQKASDRLSRWLDRYGTWFVFGFRFLYGVRTVTPAFLGLSHYPSSRFVMLNGAGAAVWSTVVVGLGWFLGASVERLLGRTAHVEEAIVGIVVLAVLIWFGRRAWRARKTGA